MHLAAEQERMSDAWRVLFGAGLSSTEWDQVRWQHELRRAFRRRALETHPDRAAALGRDATELAEEFRRVADAFAFLSEAAIVPGEAAKVPQPERTYPAATTSWRAAPRQSAAASFYKGQMPSWRLRFAEYLYYSGRVSWNDHIASLTWQRSVRPTIGQLAREWSYFSQQELLELLRRHPREGKGEPLGEFAARCGYLTRFQLMALLGKQRSFGLPIGRFFVDRGLCVPAEIDSVLELQRRHAI